MEFLDTLVYIEQQNKLQNFLIVKSKHPYSLKKSIPYSQTLWILQICSTLQDHHSHSRKLVEQFVNREYKKHALIQQIQKVDQRNRKQLLHQLKRHDKQCIPLSVTYSQALPNLEDILTKHWHILPANQICEKTFSKLPKIAYRKDTSMKQITGANSIQSKEALIKIIITHESVSHAFQYVAFAVNNLFHQQHLKVIKPTKRLKYTVELTVKPASLLI